MKQKRPPPHYEYFTYNFFKQEYVLKISTFMFQPFYYTTVNFQGYTQH